MSSLLNMEQYLISIGRDPSYLKNCAVMPKIPTLKGRKASTIVTTETDGEYLNPIPTYDFPVKKAPPKKPCKPGRSRQEIEEEQREERAQYERDTIPEPMLFQSVYYRAYDVDKDYMAGLCKRTQELGK